MSTAEIIRAWKDEEYMTSLEASELAAIPENPVGTVELIRSNPESNPDVSFVLPVSICCTKAINCTKVLDCTIDTHCA